MSIYENIVTNAFKVDISRCDPLVDSHVRNFRPQNSLFQQNQKFMHINIRIFLLDTTNEFVSTISWLHLACTLKLIHVTLVPPSTAHLIPTNEARVYLNNSSTQLAVKMVENINIHECLVIPVFPQQLDECKLNSINDDSKPIHICLEGKTINGIKCWKLHLKQTKSRSNSKYSWIVQKHVVLLIFNDTI
ncbi:hypothetical protein BD770DRAFT_423933 [Pilaira anomala]|nr:hypothetical protein BD770DRAFT_423933 [Pilaira anomala]